MEWIKATERLPDNCDWFLVSDGNYVGCAFFMSEYVDGELENTWSSADDDMFPDAEDDTLTVTHWMPLPERPAVI